VCEPSVLGMIWGVRMKRLFVATVIVSVLSACTSDPKPNLSTVTPTPPSTSVSPSPSVATTGPNVRPGGEPPVLPDAAKQHSVGGAQIFASRVVLALDWGYSTGDSAIVKSLYADGCGPCAKQVAAFDNLKESGGRFVGGHLDVKTVAGAQLDPKHPSAEQAVDVRFGVEALSVLDQGGKVVEGPYPAEVATIRFYLAWLTDGWKVVYSINVVK
jgi:hypothetical protein